MPVRLQKYPESCGWAAAAIVTDYYGGDTERLGPEERWADRQLSMLDIKEATEAAGLRTTAGTVDDLASCPLPAIMLVDHGRDPDREDPEGGHPHFVVVFAVTAERVLFSDPGEGRIIEMPRRWFERVWTGTAAVFNHQHDAVRNARRTQSRENAVAGKGEKRV